MIEDFEENMRLMFYEFGASSEYDEIARQLGYEGNDIPTFSDHQYCERLMQMNEYSAYPFDCHPTVLSAIEDYATRRRNTIRVALGRSKLYFDLFEMMLDRYDMPTEIKYLAVVESMLLPKAKSRAGALGLWQFMYGTGKMFGLVENSYIDERMDPYKATEAACQYLTKLYGIYDDWNLALAAYNAGPGNVNKAIRRANGKTTYWEVRPYLPKETQDYVPRFMAIAYLMEFHQLHNIKPTQIEYNAFDVDTVCLRHGIQMQRLEALVGISTDDVKALNPIYKSTYIPKTEPQQCITLPVEKIALFIEYEDDLYQSNEQFLNVASYVLDSNTNVAFVTEYEYQMKYHKVKSGETLNAIAKKYGTTTSKLMKLNGLRSSKLKAGQTLKVGQTKVEVKKPLPASVSLQIDESGNLQQVDSLTPNENPNLRVLRHQVKAGQTLYLIAQHYKVTVDDIVKWNNMSTPQVFVGQVIIIYTDDPNMTVEQDIKPNKPAQTNSKSNAKYHTVKQGDTLGAIAKKHGTTVAAIQKLNPRINPSKLSIGQKIRVK